MEFEWDDVKAASNRRKHGFSFDEARTIFEPADPFVMFDEDHSQDEMRYIAIGFSDKSRILTVAFCRPQLGWVRIISARKTTRKEVEFYEQAKAKDRQDKF